MKFIYNIKFKPLTEQEMSSLFKGVREIEWVTERHGERYPNVIYLEDDIIENQSKPEDVISVIFKNGHLTKMNPNQRCFIRDNRRVRPADKITPEDYNEVYKSYLKDYEQRWYLCSEKLPPDPIEADGVMLSNAQLLVAFDTGYPDYQGELSYAMYMGKGEWLGDSEGYPIYAWYPFVVHKFPESPKKAEQLRHEALSKKCVAIEGNKDKPKQTVDVGWNCTGIDVDAAKDENGVIELPEAVAYLFLATKYDESAEVISCLISQAREEQSRDHVRLGDSANGFLRCVFDCVEKTYEFWDERDQKNTIVTIRFKE